MMFRRLSLIALTVAGLIAIFGLVVLSPFALGELVHYRHDWNQLSDVGQTYGAVSALLSSLALAGVVVSLLLQARDNQTAREQTTRTLQFDLIKMQLNDPSLMTAGGAPWDLGIPSESSPIRTFLYIRMWVSFLAGNYIIGETSGSDIRYIAAHELFRSEAGRNYWAVLGQLQIRNSKGRHKKFLEILDDEYRNAIASGVPVASPIKVSDNFALLKAEPAQQRPTRRFWALTLAIAAGALAKHLWHRQKIRS